MIWILITVFISNRIYFGEKIYEYCLGYINDHEIKPLKRAHVKIKASTYVKSYLPKAIVFFD